MINKSLKNAFSLSRRNKKIVKVRLAGNSISKQLLRDGEELIDLGFEIEEIQTILQEELFFIMQKKKLLNFLTAL